jgi:hypothetical protein
MSITTNKTKKINKQEEIINAREIIASKDFLTADYSKVARDRGIDAHIIEKNLHAKGIDFRDRHLIKDPLNF